MDLSMLAGPDGRPSIQIWRPRAGIRTARRGIDGAVASDGESDGKRAAGGNFLKSPARSRRIAKNVPGRGIRMSRDANGSGRVIVESDKLATSGAHSEKKPKQQQPCRNAVME